MKRRSPGAGLDLLVDEHRVEAAMWRAHLDAPSANTRSSLFMRYMAFARRTAHDEWHRTGGHGFEREDFEQLANEGLLQAIDRFDAVREARFESYARHRIRGCILNGLSKASEASSQFSYRKRVERERLRSLRPKVESSLPVLEQLADLAVKVALGALLETRAEIEPDHIVCSAPTAFETLAWNQLCGEVDRRIAQLPHNEAFVLDRHYRHGLQFQQIAGLLGVSKGRVSQLHAQGLAKLRRYLSHQR
jgi:RNA polymerase sigma factor for flagellar operon FliA